MANNWKIIREENDPIALRLSIGSPHVPNVPEIKENGYIVYRGDTEDCLVLLREAVLQLEKHLKEQGE